MIQPELLKLQVPVLLMSNLCKISLRLTSRPAFIALSWAGALRYSRFLALAVVSLENGFKSPYFSSFFRVLRFFLFSVIFVSVFFRRFFR